MAVLPTGTDFFREDSFCCQGCTHAKPVIWRGLQDFCPACFLRPVVELYMGRGSTLAPLGGSPVLSSCGS